MTEGLSCVDTLQSLQPRYRSVTSLCTREALCCGVQHIFDKNTISGRWVVHQHVGHCADELAILNNGRAGHVCVKYRTKEFCVFLRFLCVVRGKRQVFTYLDRSP